MVKVTKFGSQQSICQTSWVYRGVQHTDGKPSCLSVYKTDDAWSLSERTHLKIRFLPHREHNDFPLQQTKQSMQFAKVMENSFKFQSEKVPNPIQIHS